MLITKQPKKATSNSYATLAQYLYLAGDTKGGDQAAAQAKAVKGADASTIDTQLKQVQQLGQQLQTAIKQLTKQQQKTQGATGGGATGGATGGAQPPQRPRHRRAQRRLRRALASRPPFL